MKLLRAAGAAAVMLILGLLGAAPASAIVTPTPSATYYACLDEEGYAPDGVCQIVVEAQTVCRDDLPWLVYDVQTFGTPSTTVTLTWQNPGGPDLVMADRPLSGSVLWPGAEIVDGVATDWPGWDLVDGEWVEGDEWDWVRPSVDVLFQANPESTVTAHYPEATAPCADPDISFVSADDPGTAVLAATGSTVQPLLLAAAGALLLGSVILAVRAAARHNTAGR